MRMARSMGASLISNFISEFLSALTGPFPVPLE